jgi:hypothetical protein
LCILLRLPQASQVGGFPENLNREQTWMPVFTDMKGEGFEPSPNATFKTLYCALSAFLWRNLRGLLQQESQKNPFVCGFLSLGVRTSFGFDKESAPGSGPLTCADWTSSLRWYRAAIKARFTSVVTARAVWKNPLRRWIDF